VVSESRVMWATFGPILVFLGLSVLDLGPIYATNRQTDVRQKHRLMSPPTRGGGITSCALGRHNMPPPRPATEARIGSLEPGQPSRAGPGPISQYALSPPTAHMPPADRMYATDRQTDRRQTASSLNDPWAGA